MNPPVAQTGAPHPGGPPPRGQSPKSKPVQTPRPAGRSLDILLCESSPSERRRIHGFLQRKGHRVESHETIVALRTRLLRDHRAPDLLICDMETPGLDPLHLLVELERARFNGQVVLTTASPDPRLADHCMQAFAHVCLVKPIRLTLLQQVAALIKGPRPPAPKTPLR